MGANQPGDIELLCKIANPTHGVITNIAPAHLEGFGDIENVTKTKGALFEHLSEGISFVNAADYRIKKLNISGKFITFGLTSNCDYPADIHHNSEGSIVLTIDSEEVITERIDGAKLEMEISSEFKYQIINNSLETAFKNLLNIIFRVSAL